MSNKSPLLSDKTSFGAPFQFRSKGQTQAYTYAGNGKDRTKAYSSNRTKPRRKKK